MSLKSFLRKIRKQKALYWAPLAVGGQGRADTFEDPVEIDCRWTDVTEETVAPFSNRFTSKAKVIVDRVLAEGGLLMKGLLTDLLSTEHPSEAAGCFEIMLFQNIPDIKAKDFLYMATLGVRISG
jgi:hypothetical protein